MYLPQKFQNKDKQLAEAVCRENPFATLIFENEGVKVNHLPLVVSQDGLSLRGHFARANSDFKLSDESTECVAVFHGPHSYISPTWYPDPREVPTWNYVVVHLRGILRLNDQKEFLLQNLKELVEAHDPAWSFDDNRDYIESLLPAIMGFEIQVQEREAKFKLSQHRQDDEKAAIVVWLSKSKTTGERYLAEMMKSVNHLP